MTASVVLPTYPSQVLYQFERLDRAGMRRLPLPGSTGRDDGVLFFRIRDDCVYLVAAWAENYAVVLVVPSNRNWADPFEPSNAIHRTIGTLETVVDELLDLIS